MYTGFASAHDSWGNLGLYVQVDLKSQWQSFQHDFRATADDYNARILFDLGEKNVSVDIDSVMMDDVTDKTSVEPVVTPSKYLVSYRLNAKGCRGGDYAIPKPTGVYRILLLGGSFTLGTGVYEDDTFSSLLQRSLDEKTKNAGLSARKYEVINCGTHINAKNRDAIFYSLFAADYNADLVIQVISPLFRQVLWGASVPETNSNMPEQPFPQLTSTAEEILQLDSEVKNSGGRFVVAVLRPDSDYSGSSNYGKIWNVLIKNFTQRVHLDSGDLPVLILGGKVYKENDYKNLLVFPGIDEDPNEIVHRDVAGELLDALSSLDVLKPNS